MSTSIIKIPTKLQARLNEEHATIILGCLIPFSRILKENKLYFFPEYTDHGINHIEGVLKSIENLIADDTIEKLSSLDICAIIIATALHDIGMHTNDEMFRNMIQGKYDNIPGNIFKQDKTWAELWNEYLKDSRFWNPEKKKNIFGDMDHTIKEPNIDDLQSLDTYDRKFIGEFIRTHHARLAYEIALNGYIGKEMSIGFAFSTNHDLNNKKFIQLAGLIARSHCMNLRETFDYLIKLSGATSWKKPIDIKVVFLMALIRIADYLQIDSSRTDDTSLKIRTIYSPYSLREHETHLAIDCVQLNNDDNERIVVEASPENAEMYVKIERLVKDIQHEFDLSWAILGEVYGDEYKLRYRRIVTNITDEKVKEGYDFVPKKFGFKFNSKLSTLLIAPLYGDDPSYGVRELAQNAVDACRTRMAIDQKYNTEDIPNVRIILDTKTELFSIIDTGIGMTIEEIEQYFLTIGSSYNSSLEWLKTRDLNNTYRSGRFGIGVLAAFLLGDTIEVETKSIKSKKGYSFKASLNSNFIQINKVPYDSETNMEYGTTIRIHCNHHSFKSLERECADKNIQSHRYISTYSIPYWYNWYINDLPNSPIIEYCIDGRVFIPYQSFKDGYKKLHHTSHYYGDIYWQPQRLFSEKKPRLFCNGFFICQNSNKNDFSITRLGRYYSLKIPSLIISDIYNRLPLNLQRNNIEGNCNYDFENDLAKEMYVDLICQLMAIDDITKYNFRYFYFNKDGFALKNGYLNKYLEGKYIFHIGIIDNKRFNFIQWTDILNNLSPNVIISFHIESLSYISSKKEISSWFSCYQAFAIINLKNFTEGDRHLIWAISNKYSKNIEFNKNDDSMKSKQILPTEIETDFEFFISKVLFYKPDYPLYILVEKNIPSNNNSSAFNSYLYDDLFDKCLGSDPFIPFRINDRKKKFSFFYESHENDINEYLKLNTKDNQKADYEQDCDNAFFRY